MSKRPSLARANAKLRQIVGSAHQLVDAAHARPDRSHAGVRCSDGCAYAPAGCCSLLTLVELAEADYIVDRNAETVRRVLPALLDADRKINELIKPADVVAMFNDEAEERRVAAAYHGLRITCPFLGSDRRCSIYRDRPIACRTHFVLSEPAECAELGVNYQHVILDKGTRLSGQAYLMSNLSRKRDVRIGTLPQLVLIALAGGGA